MSRGRGRGDFGNKRQLPADVMQRIQADDGGEKEDKLYPAQKKYLPSLRNDVDIKAIVDEKNDFRKWFRNSPFFISTKYSTGYGLDDNSSNSIFKKYIPQANDEHRRHSEDDWLPDWTKYPKELDWCKRRAPPARQVVLGPQSAEYIDRLITGLRENDDQEDNPDDQGKVIVKIEQGEKNEEEDEEDARWGNFENDEDEEDIDNDYMESYFDNGEDFGGDVDEDDRETNYD